MRKIAQLIESVFLLIFFIMLIFSPQAAFDGAWRGIKLWALTLLPSLLPFLILSELLLSSSVIRFFGRLLEPVMRPIFHLPGVCSFALALGFTSGFPMGAAVSASLAREKLCSKEEAARLAAFTNNSSPLFILSAVALGMLGFPQAGPILLLAHYGSNLVLGIILGIFAPRKNTVRIPSVPAQHPASTQAFAQSIRRAIGSILNIGGFVTLFSVIIALGENYGLFTFLNHCFAYLLTFSGFSAENASGLSYGLLEMTLGINELASGGTPLLSKLILISFVLGWGGLCVQAQVASILIEENISVKYFLLLRPLQALLSSILTIVFFHFFLAKPMAVGVFFTETIASSPLLSSFFITLLPLFILLGTVLIMLLFTLGYKLLYK